MSFYDQQGWSAPGRQPSWEQPAPPSRSGAASVSSNTEPAAFLSQIEEVDRAMDNLVKSGKLFGGIPGMSAMPPTPSMPSSRRDSMPVMGRTYSDYERSNGPSRHHSVHEHEGSRSNSSAGLQGFYAAQRFQPRQSEAEQVMQQKRRQAAQRERELRNYHQEQQFNRSASTNVKSDRSTSPSAANAMSDDERRDLIARQHRALYGDNAAMYNPDSSSGPRPSGDVRLSVSAASGSARGPSPLAFDPFGGNNMHAQQSGTDSAVQMPPRDHAPERQTSASPGASGVLNRQTAGTPPRNSPSIPQQGGGGVAVSAAGSVPIGTRPAGGPAGRSTTPNERSASAASSAAPAEKTPGLGSGVWGGNGGVWGKNALGVQASVWG